MILKTIMIIDGADNCAYDCFLADEELYEAIFPELGQDIEFYEDVKERGLNDELNVKFGEMWKRPVVKSAVSGIDGILFYNLLGKKKHYPTKRDSDLDNCARGFSIKDFQSGC